MICIIIMKNAKPTGVMQHLGELKTIRFGSVKERVAQISCMKGPLPAKWIVES